ncbi:MAG TPA: threonine/serine dehydratase [Vicinamibacteria bacterium]|nr:threonine/serine dehydratase [Vicinamibacteria bacterium]
MANLPSLEEIREARARIRGVVRKTPLVPADERFGAEDVYLKLETFQPVGSFKLRGIFNAVAALEDRERERGVSTVSAGNTAQALAWSARRFGVGARSVMPESAPQAKIEAVRAYGGEPVLVPVSEVFRYLREEGWKDEPYAFIHPWTNRNVMTGHASLGMEILEDLPDVETVLVPVGGGGLLAGVGSALRAAKPSVRVVAVEPTGCAAFHRSLEAARPMETDCNTICDGVAVPYVTGEMFPLLRDLAARVVLISEDGVKWAVKRLALWNKVVAEPSGALAIAAALAIPKAERGKTVALVTGGSIDPAKLSGILAEE